MRTRHTAVALTRPSPARRSKPVTPSPWAVETLARNIHRITLNLDRVGATQRVLLQSDVHWDNPHCMRGLFVKHLDEALEYRAPVIDAGDFFCAMQGRFDKRSSKSDIRPEHVQGNYLDALGDTAAEFLRPYRDILTVRGKGNHESGVYKNHETCLTTGLVGRLRAMGAPHIVTGGYSGYVVFRIIYGQTRQKPFILHYHHGAGGGGPVTRGVIQTNRQAVYIADADFVLNGHTHDQWRVTIQKLRLSHDLRTVVHCAQEFIRTPGYKEEYGDGYGGFHIEKWGPPKPLGACWLEFKHVKGGTIEYDVIDAK